MLKPTFSTPTHALSRTPITGEGRGGASWITFYLFISLRNNKLGAEGGKAIAGAPKVNTSITNI